MVTVICTRSLNWPGGFCDGEILESHTDGGQAPLEKEHVEGGAARNQNEIIHDSTEGGGGGLGEDSSVDGKVMATGELQRAIRTAKAAQKESPAIALGCQARRRWAASGRSRTRPAPNRLALLRSSLEKVR